MATMSPEDFSRAQLNLETAQIAWRELQRHFASGVVIAVSSALDLVEVALQISQDNKSQVAQWLDSGKIGRVTDGQALAWYKDDVIVWAVVARPYVLIQESRHVLHC
ncbi:MAG: DUF2288 domain-containing protein [Sideroxyarcus sp.]|nr:DUF2288 domain-containing protein [Sideroxyarcus sp.]